MAPGGSLAGAGGGSLAGSMAIADTPFDAVMDIAAWWSSTAVEFSSGVNVSNIHNLAVTNGNGNLDAVSGPPTYSAAAPGTIRCDLATPDFAYFSNDTDLVGTGTGITICLATAVDEFHTNQVVFSVLGNNGSNAVVAFRPRDVTTVDSMRGQVFTNAGTINLDIAHADPGQHVWTITYNPATGVARMYRDDEAVGATATLGTALVYPVDSAVLGASNSIGTSPANCNFTDCVLIDRVISASELDALRAVMMRRAGV